MLDTLRFMKNCQIIDYGKINCRLYWNDDDNNKRFLLSVYLLFCAEIKERLHDTITLMMMTKNGKNIQTHTYMEINCQDFARNWKWWSRHHTKCAHNQHCELKDRELTDSNSRIVYFSILNICSLVFFLILCFIVSIDLSIFVCTSKHTRTHLNTCESIFFFSHRLTAEWIGV